MIELKDVNARKVLALPLPPGHESDAATVGGYLIELLLAAWDSPDMNPFGNSGWQWDLLKPLAQAGLITIPFDEDGYLGVYEDSERKRGEDIISMVIKSLLPAAEPPAPVELPPLDQQVEVLTSLLSHLRLRLEWIERGADYASTEGMTRGTPEQLWGRLLQSTATQRLESLRRLGQLADEANRCFLGGHHGVIEELRKRVALLEERVIALGGDLP